MHNIMIENTDLQLGFNPLNGALCHFCVKKTGWEILKRDHLGLSYKLLIPKKEKRNNIVLGEHQKLDLIEVSPDNRQIQMVWKEQVSCDGDKYLIRINIVVELADHQAVFKLSIDNQSDSIIENVFFPYLGDLQQPENSKWFKTFSQHLNGAQERGIWPTFDNMRGYFSIDHPTQLHPAYIDGVTMWGPIPHFILLRGEKEGLYCGVGSPTDELVTWHLELHPGYDSMMTSKVPQLPAIGEKEIYTKFAAVHIPYVMPNETRELTPIRMAAFQGGWQQGADVYRRWRQTWMVRPPLPSWVKDPHSWQELQVNSPEGEYRTSYSDLEEIGAECAKNGVSAIQLVGWNIGGQDGNIPFHEPDPYLGGEEEFKRAIRRIHDFGVKVILFTKFTWADRLNPEFQKIGSSTIKDPYGDTYQFEGYQYHTITQLLDINTRRLIPMCFLDEKYLNFCEDQFRYLLSLGIDGILVDCCLEHTPALLCFDPNHGHRYGAFVFANDREIIHRFTKIGLETNREILFSGEAPYDWEFEAYHMGYIRSYRKDHIPLMRYLLPNVPIMTAVTGFNDRHMINQALLYRYAISYEPYNFKGRLSDFPLTVHYGQLMDALRNELRDYFWDGEFQHEIGATVMVNQQPHHPYAVYRNRENGQYAVAIANYDDENEISVQVRLTDGSTLSKYRLVDDSEWKVVSEKLNIPPRCAAVVI